MSEQYNGGLISWQMWKTYSVNIAVNTYVDITLNKNMLHSV